MRLITHNMLQCHAKGCTTNNFPLLISEVELEEIEADFNPDFIEKMLTKIDWPALYQTAYSLGILIPESLPQDLDQDFLQNLHHVLLETRIKEGKMTCKNCGHIFPIKDSIPNMLLQDNEV